MNPYKKILTITIILATSLCALCALCACGYNTGSHEEAALETGATGYIPGDYVLEKPENPPLPIYVNSIGFLPSSKKTLIFSDAVTDKTFEIINADSRKAVYIGNIISNGGIGYGDFTLLKDTGYFYARVSGIGESKTFLIGEDVYAHTVTALKNQHIAMRDRMFNESADSMSSMEWDCLIILQELIYLEVDANRANNAFYSDANANEALQKVAERLMKRAPELFANYRQSLYVTGTLCRLSQFFEAQNEPFAKELSEKAAALGNELLKLDITAYNSAEYRSYEYFAYCALYSLTGNASYHEKVKERAKIVNTDKEYYNKNAAALLWHLQGDYDYLNASFKTDAALCDEIIAGWQGEVLNILGSPIHVQEHFESHDSVFTFIDSVYLFLMDYILSGNEYEYIQDDIIDYYAGRNSNLSVINHENPQDSLEWENTVFLFLLM